MGLVRLQTYDGQLDAELARSRLEAAGIQSFCFDENDVYAIGVRLMVNEADLAAARAVLREVGLGDAESDRIAADADRLRRHLAWIALAPLAAVLICLVYEDWFA